MAYTEYLVRLLSPLGVYDLREDSVSGAAVAALGETLDECWDELRDSLADAFPATAGEAGLARWERLLPLYYRPEDADARRAMAEFYLSLGEADCFASTIVGALAACGFEAAVDEETAAPSITVTLSGASLTEAELAKLGQYVRNFLPAHRRLVWNTDE